MASSFRPTLGQSTFLLRAQPVTLRVELKLGRRADAALGQILRYMGWVGRHLSTNKKVFGVVFAADISEKLRYAATQVPQVRLMEYELSFAVKPAALSSTP
jgi:endonuclease